MNWTIEENTELYNLLLSAMYSENIDYIEEQLNQIYKKILQNNIYNFELEFNKEEE